MHICLLLFHGNTQDYIGDAFPQRGFADGKMGVLEDTVYPALKGGAV